MNNNQLLQLAAQFFQGSLDRNHDGQMDIGEIAGALGQLFNNNSLAQGGGLGGLIGALQGAGGGDLGALVNSWLGAGSNQAVSPDQLQQMLGEQNISDFAQGLGLSTEQAVSGLQAALPQAVDQASPNGSLDLDDMLASVGGVSGALDLAGKLFGR